MCEATRPNKAKIGGYLSLLQSWARFRFSFLRPRVDHPYTFSLITRWNHSASYVGIPTSLEDIRLLLDQQSEAQFQWTPYEDPTIRVVITDEFFQNPNIWHVNVPLVNYTTVEMHQSDKVLRQFGFQQPIPVAPEVFDNEHGVDLQQLHTDWPRFWSHYIKMPINSAHTITEPINSAHTITLPNTSTNDTHIIAFSDYASPMVGWNSWLGSYPFPITLSQPPIYRPLSHKESHEAPSGSSSFYQSSSPYGIQTPLPWSLFYQCGSPSQHSQLDPLPEEPQSPPEAEPRKNPVRNRRRPPRGTNFDRHQH
ncbi:hypothetical protein J1N35_045258 [Gossypium stocksii]|uniref:Aminotransferase-like plant mobile domain-containing protein n=1 Tax=Gossypium stocksii TaxID=47602 RepID=A0A9D3UAU0_9ROSI|nr:hypothetical protein J1N35_045258 [Gossypium stocksii]